MAEDQVSLVVAGMEITRWLRYEVESDITVEADAFSLAVDGFDAATRDLVTPGATFKLYLDGNLQHTGVVDTVSLVDGRGGRALEIAGRDLGGHLVTASAPPTYFGGRTLGSVAEELCEPWGISVVANDGTARLRAAAKPKAKRKEASQDQQAQDVTPQPGDTVWGFLLRHCQRAGLWLWMSPDGQLVIGRPCYTQDPLYSIVRYDAGDDLATGNNRLDGTLRRDWSGRFSSVKGIGEGASGSSRLSHTETDAEVTAAGLHRPMRYQDSDARSAAQLQQSVRTTLAQQQWDSWEVTYDVPGHSQDGAYWQPDTLVAVADDVLGILDTLYVAGRTFRRTREEGCRTSLRLRKAGIWLA